jgi:mono/diheme cytochrome c family protein
MAYPLLLALMDAYPAKLGSDWHHLAERFGFNEDPEAKGDPRALPLGFHLATDPNTHVPWVVGNCQLCHSDRIRLPTGDLIVPGMGSKRVRPHAYAQALMDVALDPALDPERLSSLASEDAAARGITWPSEVEGAAIVRATLKAMKAGAEARSGPYHRFDGALPGRMGTIESFALAIDAYRDEPIQLAPDTGWAKVPDISGFPYRETFSYDASGYGSPQALVEEADFLFGARPEWYLTHSYIATSMYLYLRDFERKLPYPGPLDAGLVERGRAAFEQTCARCHGTYVQRGGKIRASYEERVVPQSIVGTDPARESAVTQSFVDAANALPLTRGLTRLRNTGGYVPPVLIDVWARGLYGHAGQWPSLEVMATPPESRPQRFVVDTNGLYDLERVGVRYRIPMANEREEELKPGEYLYDGTRPGFHVEGHTFLSALPADDRRAVIEYLKTL